VTTGRDTDGRESLILNTKDDRGAMGKVRDKTAAIREMQVLEE